MLKFEDSYKQANITYKQQVQVEKLRYKSSGSLDSAFERYQQNLETIRKHTLDALSQNIGYALELQFVLYCDESVMDKTLSEAFEALLMHKIKSFISHE